MTIVDAELWKLGQLRPGDKLRFQRDRRSRARASPTIPSDRCSTLPASATHAAICVRRAGESNLLVEFGAPVLDLVLRFQVQALLEELQHAQARRHRSI